MADLHDISTSAASRRIYKGLENNYHRGNYGQLQIGGHDEVDYVPRVVVPVTRATYLYAFCASVNSCNIGFDIGVSTEVGRLIQADFSLSRTSLVHLFVCLFMCLLLCNLVLLHLS